MAAVQVERAGADDADVVAGLFDAYRQFYRQTSDLAGARAFIGARLAQGDAVVLVARVHEATVGFVQLYPSFTSAGMARIFILNHLFVTPEARGCGVAAALLRHAAEFARTAGAVRLTLSTARDNLRAQSIYEAAGWTRDESFLGYNLPLA